MTTSDLLGKVLMAVIASLLAVCALVGSMVGWYVAKLTDEVAATREAVTGFREELSQVKIAVEVQAGGNPFDPE